MASKNTETKKLTEEKIREQKDKELKEYLEESRAVDMKHRKAFHPIIQHLKDGSIVPRMVVVDLVEDNKE